MYSVVLLAALTSAVESPERGRRGGGGCCGCYGGGYYGGGGCYGGGCYGGWGGGYGFASCGCYGGGSMYFGYGCMGASMGFAPGAMGQQPVQPGQGGSQKIIEEDRPGGTKKKIKEEDDSGGKKKVTPPDDRDEARQNAPKAPAFIIVTVPAEARIYFDGQATSSVSSTRVFVTPVLNRGRTYQYKLTGELVREGRTERAEQLVDVRSGKTTRIRLNFPDSKLALK